MNKTLLIQLLLISLPLFAAAQTVKPSFNGKQISGVPFIRNYTPDEYQASGQNWAVAQDQNGMMYFGNNGVLEYDGVVWRLIPTDKKTVVRSLAVDKENRVYVGAYGEIGYLAPDKNSQLQYHSLLPHLEKQYLDFSDVWQTIATSDGVYFVTQKYVFRWAKQRMHIWKAQQNFHVGFSLNDQFYVRQWGVGLMRAEGDSLNLAPDGARLADERVFAMLPWSGTKSGGKALTLIATRANGLFLYDGVSLTAFPTDADAILKEAVVYHGVQLPNGNYAFATLKNGVVVIDGEGRWVHHLNKASGLQDETVWFLYVDRQGGLWMGSDAGISRVEIGSPFTQFTNLEGVEGYVLGFARHQGTLYVASSLGTYYLDETKGGTGSRRFKRLAGIPPQCWALLSMGESLLVGSFDGVFEVRGQQVKLLDMAYTVSLHRSLQDTNRVFVGLQNGMMSLYREGARWRVEGRLDSVDLEIRNMLETPDQKLWVTPRFQGILKVDYASGHNAHAPIVRYDTLHGLPPGDRNFAFLTAKGLRFGTKRGIYRLDETQQRFVPDTSLIKGFPADQTLVLLAAKDACENLYFLYGEKSDFGRALLQKDGSYTWEGKPMLRIAGANAESAYSDPFLEGLNWIGGNNRVILYDASVAKNYELEFSTQIRQVIANGDSLIFGGAGSGAAGSVTKLPFAENTLRFSYSAPSYDDESKNEYQYRLDGYDDDWSKWTSEPHKDYTKLPAGTYRFLVRAKNIYGHVGTIASFDFNILPPFYQTWWAYLFYALLFIGAGYALRQYEVGRLRRKQAQEIEHLELNKLKELDQLKSRFFADISHEFRTPLTVILGMTEQLALGSEQWAVGSERPVVKSKLALVKRSGENLLRLINQILDLAKLESNSLKINYIQGDVLPYLRYISESLHSLANAQNVMVRVESDQAAIVMDYDPERLLQIVHNLLSNAIKFTPSGGRVVLRAGLLNLQDFGNLVLTVTDTGAGIPAEDLPNIFDRFYQASNLEKAKAGGTGIGLALTKELVGIMGGEIGVESEVGKGATFTVRLPVTQSPLTPKGEPYSSNSAKTLGEMTTELPGLGSPLGVRGVLATGLSHEGNNPTIQQSPEGAGNNLLLIEDNPDVVEYLTACLRDSYALDFAYNGRSGIEKALETIPDLILSDVMMPEKDGFEVTDTLKNDERTSHIPIVLLTAKADIQSRLDGLRRGADAYLSKPFHQEELKLTLANLLEMRKKMQAKYGSWQLAVSSQQAATGPLLPTGELPTAELNLEDAFIKKIIAHLEKHLDDAEYSIPQLSRAMGLSQSQLYRKIKALTDLSTAAFIRRFRLLKGKHLLETTQMNISEIAYQVGFTSLNYFSDAFLEEFGQRPNAMRN